MCKMTLLEKNKALASTRVRNRLSLKWAFSHLQETSLLPELPKDLSAQSRETDDKALPN